MVALDQDNLMDPSKLAEKNDVDSFCATKSSEASRLRAISVILVLFGVVLILLGLENGFGLVSFEWGNALGSVTRWAIVLAGSLMVLMGPLVIKAQSMVLPVVLREGGLQLPGQSIFDLLRGRSSLVPFEDIVSFNGWNEDGRSHNLGPYLSLDYSDRNGRLRKVKIYERQVKDPSRFLRRTKVRVAKHHAKAQTEYDKSTGTE